MALSRFALLALTLIPSIAAAESIPKPPVIPAANGTWPGWRGNPQHTGYQALPGRISKPRVLWKFPLGGDPGLPGLPVGLKVTDIQRDGIPDVISAPASSSHISVYSLSEVPPKKVWDVDIPDFVSDPYTPSQIVVGRRQDMRKVIFLVGGRHQVPVIELDAANGDILARRTFEFPGHNFEAGGSRQLVLLRTTRRGTRLIVISDYRSNQTYMFHGAISMNAENLFDAKVLDTYPFGLHFVDGCVGDFAGDGGEEILVSRFDPVRKRHDALLLDPVTLAIRRTFPDLAIQAIIPAGAHSWTVIAQVGVHTEIPPAFGTLQGYTLRANHLVSSKFRVLRAAVCTARKRWNEDTATGDEVAAVTFAAKKTRPGILLETDRDEDGIASEFVIANLHDGRVQARYEAAPGVALEIIAGPTGTATEVPLLIHRNDGWSVTLSDSLQEIRRIRVDNFARNTPGNDHTGEIAAVADLDGNGKTDVVAVDGASRLLKLDLHGATPTNPPTATTLWGSGTPQEILAIPNGRGSALLVRRRIGGQPAIGLIDGHGTLLWEHRFGTKDTEDVLPSGMNWGRISTAIPVAVVASGGAADVFPRQTYLLDARDGSLIWKSKSGTFWDATFAVCDIDGDTSDDLIFNNDTDKGLVLSGATSAILSNPVNLPTYRTLGFVDYNGAPVVAAIHDDSVDVLENEDDAHIALLRYSRQAHQKPEIVWAVEQSALDDERYSSAAIAPYHDSWMLANGSASGWLRARRGKDGALLWKIHLGGGSINDTSEPIPLSGVVAVDVDGDGEVDFVFCGADGWLYAVDSLHGQLKWSLYLGPKCGSPIAADIDGDGHSEILVPAAGHLTAIGPAL